MMTVSQGFVWELCHLGSCALYVFNDLSDTFFVWKMQLLGGQRSPGSFGRPKAAPMYMNGHYSPRAAFGHLKVAFSKRKMCLINHLKSGCAAPTKCLYSETSKVSPVAV